VKGVVTDAESGEVLPSAQVFNDGKGSEDDRATLKTPPFLFISV